MPRYFRSHILKTSTYLQLDVIFIKLDMHRAVEGVVAGSGCLIDMYVHHLCAINISPVFIKDGVCVRLCELLVMVWTCCARCHR